MNDHDHDPRAQTPLLALIGDSYVEALMVPFAETLQGACRRASVTAKDVKHMGFYDKDGC